jgi:hypothetical protein
MDSSNVVLAKPCLLNFKTPDAQGKVFKALSKIIKANFTKASFIITEAGIFLQENNGGKTPNDPVTAILEIVLRREKFDLFTIPHIEGSGYICLGFATLDFKTAMERVSKTDSVRMYVLQENPSLLYFDILDSKGVNISTRYITLIQTEIGHVTPPEYEEHLPVANVKMSEFKRSTTEASKISKTKIRVSTQKTGMMFESIGSSMRAFRDPFGSWVDGAPLVFSEELSTARIHSFSEISATNIERIRIYSEEEKPIKFQCDAGHLGTVSLYLQPDLPN